MYIDGESVLRWLHILCMVYWLGGEWGIFQTSYNIGNPNITLEERRRHLETAYRIDILSRSGIILLLPLGLHMGFNLGVHPWGGDYITIMWAVAAVWLGLCWAAFLTRETDTGIRLTKIDESVRYVLIPVLLGAAIWSLLHGEPFNQNWYAAKVLIYSVLLIMGLLLRFVMRHWTTIFRRLATDGRNEALEAQLASELAWSRYLAYAYWVGIASVCFLGATKPF